MTILVSHDTPKPTFVLPLHPPLCVQIKKGFYFQFWIRTRSVLLSEPKDPGLW